MKGPTPLKKIAPATIWIAAFIAFQVSGVSLAADNTSKAETLFATANSADVSEDYVDAEKKYRGLIVKVRSIDPEHPFLLRAKARLARVCLMQSKFDDAEPLYYSLMISDRSNLVRIPELMIDLDDLSDAYVRMAKKPHYRYESLKRCIELRKRINPHHPRLAAAYRDLSEYCASCNNSNDAATWILKAIDLEKSVPVINRSELIRDENFLALMYMLQNKLDKAQQTAQEGIDLLPKTTTDRFWQTQTHTTLGGIYKRKGLYDRATKEYDIALKGIDNTVPKAAEIRERIRQLAKQNDEERRKAKKRN